MNSEQNGINCLLQAADFLAAQQEQCQNRPERTRTVSLGQDGDGAKDSDSSSSVADAKERRRNGGREVHNQLEKSRRAQLRDHFNSLKEVVPSLQNKRQSNQAILKGSQKFIQSLTVKERLLQQELQNLVKRNIELKGRAKSLEELLELKGISEDSFQKKQDSFVQPDDEDDASSIATESATEGPDNAHDFDDEVDIMLPVHFPKGQQARGIPHPVIRETPQISQKQFLPPTTYQNITAHPNRPVPQATVDKLLSKLSSTKQSSTQGPTVVSSKGVGMAESRVQIISMTNTTGVPIGQATAAVGGLGGTTRVPLAAPSSRPVVQSLLASAMPSTSATAQVRAPSANPTIVTATVPRLGIPSSPVSVRAPMAGLNGAQVIAGSYATLSSNALGATSMYCPSIVVKATGNSQYMTIPMTIPMTQQPNLIMVPSYPQNPAVTKHS